jgi:uncharacterized membrane protein YdbT with pleckstrin-like domain
MSYVRKVLQPGEAVVYATRLHWLIYTHTILLLIACIILAGAVLFTSDNQSISLAIAIAAVMFALLTLVVGLRAFIRRTTTELAVTDHRVIYKSGLLSRHTIEMNRDKVESVDVDQSLLGRILGYGTVIVRGTGGSLEPIRNIGDPLTFRSHITASPAAEPPRA